MAITAGIASIPSRELSLKRTIESLTKQVDMIFIGLNGYVQTPLWFDQFDNLSYRHFDNSMGDAVKFFLADNVKGYYLSCDDDLIYPKTYTEYMISKVDEHKCPVSLHGKCFDYPVSNYHRAFSKNYHCRSLVIGDHPVDVAGTGVLCFNTAQVKVTMEDFLAPNMADVWFSLLAKRQNIPLMVVEHQVGFVEYMEQPWTIWKNKVRDGKETEIVNEILRPK